MPQMKSHRLLKAMIKQSDGCSTFSLYSFSLFFHWNIVHVHENTLTHFFRCIMMHSFDLRIYMNKFWSKGTEKDPFNCSLQEMIEKDECPASTKFKMAAYIEWSIEFAGKQIKCQCESYLHGLFVCLFVGGFTSHSRTFHSYGYVIIIDDFVLCFVKYCVNRFLFCRVPIN